MTSNQIKDGHLGWLVVVSRAVLALDTHRWLANGWRTTQWSVIYVSCHMWIYLAISAVAEDFRMMMPIAHARKWGGWLRWAEP